ncbi:MAG: EamA family transporter [Candidatus Micrarchaeia archaeon]
MEIKTLANIYLVAALLTGAVVPIALDVGANNISISEFLFMAYMLAMPTSLVFVLARGKKDTLAGLIKDRKDLAIVMGIGLLNYISFEYGIAFVEKFIGAALATAVYRSYPILMFLFIPIILREKITVKQIAALGLTFLGFFAAFLFGGLQLSYSNISIIGLVLLIAIASALATTLTKRYVFDMESTMLIFNVAGFLFFAILFLSQLESAGFVMPNELSWIAILYVGIVYNVFTGFMYYGALRMKKTTVVTNFYFLSPFITFVFAFLLLGEAIKWYYLLIALFVAIGLIIQHIDLEGGKYISRSKKRTNFMIYDVTSAFVNTRNSLMYNTLKGSGRVLAVKVESGWYSRLNNLIEEAKGTDYSKKLIICADYDKENINDEERKFVRDIMGIKEGEGALISAGHPEHIENFFSEFVDKYKA